MRPFLFAAGVLIAGAFCCSMAFTNQRLDVNVNMTETMKIPDAFIGNRPQTSPFFENDSTAWFFWRGNADSVKVAGDWSDWRPLPLKRLDSEGMWFRREVFPSDARLDYKFIINDHEWILDPLNPLISQGGFGPNSELTMPHYIRPAELLSSPSVRQGVVLDTILTSTILQQERRIQIYLPADKKPLGSPRALAIFLDGSEFLNLASANTVLDNLIAAQKICPIVAAFETPHDRMAEYTSKPGEAFEHYFIDELVPFVLQCAQVSIDPQNRAVIGVSLSAAYATQLVCRNPHLFGGCAAMSPAYWFDNARVYHLVKNSSLTDVRFYLDRGVFEGRSIAFADSMKEALQNQGYLFDWHVWHEGHSWGSWRAHLKHALQFLFPHR
ncbi:MAG: hypothetical protein EHM72_14755 [Calditrichaeota bacterium]|nr:MAG: hypothetical protein EHM72_14755 [Calditrichota bacterium]